jgi:hypothetical protein
MPFFGAFIHPTPPYLEPHNWGYFINPLQRDSPKRRVLLSARVIPAERHAAATPRAGAFFSFVPVSIEVGTAACSPARRPFRAPGLGALRLRLHVARKPASLVANDGAIPEAGHEREGTHAVGPSSVVGTLSRR